MAAISGVPFDYLYLIAGEASEAAREFAQTVRPIHEFEYEARRLAGRLAGQFVSAATSPSSPTALFIPLEVGGENGGPPWS